MIGTIKTYLARRWGFVTQEEHVALLEKNLKDFRNRVEHTMHTQVNERLRLFAENKALRDRLRDAEEYNRFLREERIAKMNMTAPEQITMKGDF